jgi:outer membrane autotransporter protein
VTSIGVQARADFYQGDISGLRLDARGYSLTGNMGYSLAFGNDWTLEPSVGGVYSRTSADQMQAAGFMASQILSGTSGTSNVPLQGSMQVIANAPRGRIAEVRAKNR